MRFDSDEYVPTIDGRRDVPGPAEFGTDPLEDAIEGDRMPELLENDLAIALKASEMLLLCFVE